ncbi:MAG: hypothetical protein J7L07_02695 [Candidatus Odinarchaeota archaeon]|nr:hypothetical protein [Candidatus Odinarchaeota archaeon]
MSEKRIREIISKLDKVAGKFNKELERLKDLLTEAGETISTMIDILEDMFTDDELDAVTLKSGTLSEIISNLEDIGSELEDAIDDIDDLYINSKDLDELETLEALGELEEEEEEEEEEF